MWLIHTPEKGKARQLTNIDNAACIDTEGRYVLVIYGYNRALGIKIVCDSEEQAAFYIEDIYQAIGQKKAVWDEQAAKQRFENHRPFDIDNMLDGFKPIS